MKQEFTAVMERHEGINGAFVRIPFDVYGIYRAKRVKVLATFEGHPYQGSIVTMGGCCLIGIPQQIRREIGKTFGDTIIVTVEKDEGKRVVVIPADFLEPIEREPDLKKYFFELSFSNQKKIVNWILSAKKADTREKRVQKAVLLMRERKTL